MSKKQNKQKKASVVAVNHYRKIALITNPIILIVLVILLLLNVPFGIILCLGVVAYAAWAVVFIKANMMDRKN